VENGKTSFLGKLTSIAEVITFWVMHYIGVQTFFSQCGLSGYHKRQNFMFISKIQTYLCEEMHLKIVPTSRIKIFFYLDAF
jgi:hypothetical protein